LPGGAEELLVVLVRDLQVLPTAGVGRVLAVFLLTKVQGETGEDGCDFPKNMPGSAMGIYP